MAQHRRRPKRQWQAFCEERCVCIREPDELPVNRSLKLMTFLRAGVAAGHPKQVPVDRGPRCTDQPCAWCGCGIGAKGAQHARVSGQTLVSRAQRHVFLPSAAPRVPHWCCRELTAWVRDDGLCFADRHRRQRPAENPHIRTVRPTRSRLAVAWLCINE